MLTTEQKLHYMMQELRHLAFLCDRINRPGFATTLQRLANTTHTIKAEIRSKLKEAQPMPQ